MWKLHYAKIWIVFNVRFRQENETVMEDRFINLSQSYLHVINKIINPSESSLHSSFYRIKLHLKRFRCVSKILSQKAGTPKSQQNKSPITNFNLTLKHEKKSGTLMFLNIRWFEHYK